VKHWVKVAGPSSFNAETAHCASVGATRVSPVPQVEERVRMNCTKTKPGLLQEQPISCYRIWMKPKTVKKPDRRGYTLLGQFLMGTKSNPKP
jgi:hypothetical protein